MEQLKRLESGIEGLDALLKGGLVAGASYIVQGRPGSGKTILANQIAFNHVREGGRVLVGTLLAESHERLFQYLSTLSFFDPSKVGAEIQFVSAFDTLESEGLDEVVKLLRREISRQKATLLIVDGLLNARSKAETQIDTKKFISELQGHAAFAGCTVLFLTSSRLDDGSPEHTMVDGVIELGEELFGARSVRRIHLRKTRGSGALSGLHECEITDHGLVVHPRLESLYSQPSLPDSDSMRRIASGIDTMDRLIGGGLPESSVTLIMGPSGIGKTSLGLNFLSQSTPEAPGLHFGFYETPQRLRWKAHAIGIDMQSMEDSGALHILWQPTTEGLLDGLGARLIKAVEEKGIKRLHIDSLGGMARVATGTSRLIEFFSALMSQLRAMGVTVFATWEMRDLFAAEINAPAPELSSIVDNLILMRFVEMDSELKRLLSILKMRDSFYDSSLLEVVINDHGIELTKAFRHAAGVLSGTATSATDA
ncbi:ATPase domain-containing protein [Phytopseudomonas dryadis]|uniref:non-specific serine/threonine protein kinase n=1 Tax=Phytopseudomonas dryadis TaxID=2487520 RepID=A0A4Q9QXH9_9GAMM|nr:MULTISPECIES: ATPase domain-containing protein [Pseudomonas]TBU88145.1 serine/threonine protein kinase [Pseudomonas dryadis]TBV05406.1 serine/threonine protein kinase [Pseudomonas dryadis]TBV18415.1 serine/threonine protein kinase [Pseudomonas sp. FRB 230]